MQQAKGSCFQCFAVEIAGCGLESATYEKGTHCLISQQQELNNATVKSPPREKAERSDGVPEILPPPQGETGTP
jgi:hypothetical protein